MPTTATENKVQFGIDHVYYAVLTETVTNGVTTYSYGTPKPIPGAVSLTLDKSGDESIFYADNIAYYTTAANNGYEGDLEVARVPLDVLKDIFGMTQGTTSKVVTEMANAEPKDVALLYRISGNAVNTDYVLYKCTLGRPNIGSQTTTETKEPVTATMSIKVSPRADYKIKAHTTADTPTATVTGWYSSVFEEAAASGGTT